MPLQHDPRDRSSSGPTDVLGKVEYVEQRGTDRQLPRGVTVAVVLLFAAAAVVGWRVDAQAAERERAAIGDCASAAESALERARGYLRFMGGYVSPALTSSPPDHVREGLLDLLEDSASRGRSAVALALAECEATSVWPHHRELRAARDTYVDYVSAQLVWLDAVATDGRWAYRTSDEQEELSERLSDAEAVLER